MWKKLFTKATLVRTLSGILLVIIAIITLITGGDILFFTIAAISLIGMTELYHVLDIQKQESPIIQLYIFKKKNIRC